MNRECKEVSERGMEGGSRTGERGRLVVSKALNCTCEMRNLAEKVEENLKDLRK